MVSTATRCTPGWPHVDAGSDSPADHAYYLELRDRSLDLPAVLAPALDRLLAGPAITVRDLSDLVDEGSRQVLVRRLLREGVLRRTDGP